MGLVAAIPATIFYNHFTAAVDQIVSLLERFAVEFEEDLEYLVHDPDDGDSRPVGS